MPANDLQLLIKVTQALAGADQDCLVFGGWAEELLELRPPRPHREIDLLLCADDFRGLEAAVMALQWPSISGKIFAHKRAFLIADICCELTLVTNASSGPRTLFWGDTAYDWLMPLQHPDTIVADGASLTLVSRANLLDHRARYACCQPWRWREPGANAAIARAS